MVLCMLLISCDIPDPPPSNHPTLPAVLDITPAPTLDIDATATAYARAMRPTPTPAGLYVVREGDTLSDLATLFDTTVQEIMVANGLTDPSTLQVGQTLIIPSLLPTRIVDTPTASLEVSGTITSTTPITTPDTTPLTDTAPVTP